MAIFRCAGCGGLNRLDESRTGDGPKCGKCKSRLDVGGEPQSVDGLALEGTIAGSPVPVLVDYWARWCGPCRMATPIVADLGRRRAGRMLTLKVDTDHSPAAASARRIEALPTFVLYHRGREVARRSGVVPRAELEAWIDSELGGASPRASSDESPSPRHSH
jgi:thioredoxin 2